MKDPVALFYENVHRLTDHPAVVHESGTMTYGELGTFSRRMASAISKQSERPRVLIYLSKGAAAYGAMFAALMAGGYYSPVNMEAPVKRHIEIFRQFRPDVVVSTKKFAAQLPINGSDCVLVDIDHPGDSIMAQPADAHELAYVIFTSGTTGKPKGVMIPRDGLAHYTNWAQEAMAVSHGDRWSQHPNIAFDLSVLDIFGALCGGATLYPLTSKKDRLLPADFIRRNRLTIWNSVPSVIDLMMKARHVKKQNFESLRLMTFCGEPLFQRHLEGIFTASERVVVHNTYGPTEATVSCTLVHLTAHNYNDYCANSVALGNPIPGMGIILMGDDSEAGELGIFGMQLAKGYWENAAATEKVFVQMTVDGQNQRVYCTGDKVVKRGNELYFAGRIDSQVKIRGNRVELDEIDVMVHQLGYGNSCTIFNHGKLHCFIETNKLPDVSAFKKKMADLLPEYEIPDQIHAISRLPVNQNDKIDRMQLAVLTDEKYRTN